MAHTAIIVSRDTSTIEVLEQVARRRGMRAEHCGDAATAYLYLEERHFSLVFLDYKAEPSTESLITSIRENSTDQKPFLIALVNEQTETKDLFERGVNFLLYKPVLPERAAESLEAAWKLLPTERRRNERIPLQTQANIAFSTQEDVRVPILNLSQDGMTIYSASKMPFPCRVYFQFALPGTSSQTRLSGEVIWQDWKGHVGIRFSHVPQSSRRSIDQWLEKHAGQAGKLVSDAVLTVDRIVVQTEDNSLPETVDIPNSEEERRSLARRGCRLGVSVSMPAGNLSQQCTLTDVSAHGCYIETTQPYTVGNRVTIEVRAQDEKLHVHGKVRSTHRGYGMGIEFSLATDEEKDHVEQLMACLDAKLDIPTESILERE